MNLKWYKSLIIFFVCWSVLAQGQVVWPGDINNNGIVNSVDVLYLGLAFGNTGPVRTGGNSNWEAQPLPTLWGVNFPDGLDYAYADCNGDGEVNDNDLDDTIKDNFGFTHGELQADGFSNGAEGMDPPLTLEPETTVTEWGTMLNIGLRLGAEAFPVSNFYGIAIKMSYSAGVLNENAEEEGFDFNLEENSWIDTGDGDKVEYLFRKDHNTGKAELGITRTNQNFINQGSGIIGQFSVVVEDIIVGSETDTFTIQIDSIFFMDDQLNVYPIVPDTALIIIRDSSSSVTSNSEPLKQGGVKVYPNPAKDYFLIETKRDMESISVFNAMGIPMPLDAKQNAFGQIKIDTNQWPSGLYYLQLNTHNQTIIKKLAVVSGED